MKIKDLTTKELHEIFEYKNGDLYWKIDRSHRAKAGTKAGHRRIDKKTGLSKYQIRYSPTPGSAFTYTGARIIYKMFHGEWPKNVSFLNRDRTDTRIENLISIDRKTLSHRRIKAKANQSGYKGVHYNKDHKKWVAQLNKRHLGNFDNQEEAYVVYCDATKKLYNDLAILS